MIINISDDMIELNRAGLLKKLLEDKTTKGQILWGTDAYRERGPAFEREREIDTSLLLYENAGLLRPGHGRPLSSSQNAQGSMGKCSRLGGSAML